MPSSPVIEVRISRLILVKNPLFAWLTRIALNRFIKLSDINRIISTYSNTTTAIPLKTVQYISFHSTLFSTIRTMNQQPLIGVEKTW